MALNKPLDSITEADLQALITDEFPEGKVIDYKETLPGNAYDDKREFLADISSFANAAGGHLVFGMREEGGLPVELCGLQNIDADNEIQRLDNMVRDNIQPRIPGISMRAVPLDSGNVAVIVHVPRGWAQPHVVEFQKHWRFYSRNSSGKYPLDVLEVRSAFAMSETVAERIRGFRMERLGKIVAGETPIGLEDTARLVLHLVPVSAAGGPTNYDLSTLSSSHPGNLDPLYSGGYGYNERHNFDGFLTFSTTREAAVAYGYVQVFRNGSIEAVDTLLLSSEPDSSLSIPSVAYEEVLLKRIPRFLKVQEGLGVSPPILVMLSLLGVSGYVMAVDRAKYGRSRSYPIDRNDLILPEIMVEDFEFDVAAVMKPAFDAIWNASGWPRSMNYDEDDKWVG